MAEKSPMAALPKSDLLVELSKARSVIAKIDAMIASGYNEYGDRVYTIQNWQGYDALRQRPEFQAAAHGEKGPQK